MQEEQDQEHVGCKDIIQNHMMQIMIKGKRTKRQRLPSPLRLTMSTASSPLSIEKFTNENSGTTSSIENIRNKEEEEEDMANCLILLAQGHQVTAPSHNNNKNKEGFYFYQCKTCNRCFPSFQALGGHRAGHKKPKPSTTIEENKTVSSFVNDDHDSLTLQLSNRAMYRSSAMANTKAKVHQCSICGAEFSSGQALGGHMRRHRTSAIINNGSHETQEAKIPRNVLKLDLNLPAPDEDDDRESKFLFQSKDEVFVFSANSLVGCHY